MTGSESEIDIFTSDDIKIYYTGKLQDFTARYIIKNLYRNENKVRVTDEGSIATERLTEKIVISWLRKVIQDVYINFC